MLVGLRLQEKLVELVETVRAIIPPKALSGAIVIVEDPAMFTLTVTLVGFAEIAKSCV